jgi:dihydrofolate reductase
MGCGKWRSFWWIIDGRVRVFTITACRETCGVTFVDQAPETLMSELRKKPGKHIWLMGGGELTGEFLKADLVDELYLGIVPLLLGEGIPLFPSGFPQRDFSLTEHKSYSKGLITLKYERLRSKT